MKSIRTVIFLCFLMLPVAVWAQPQQAIIQCGLYTLKKCYRSAEPDPGVQDEYYWKRNGHKFCQAEWELKHGLHPSTQGSHNVQVSPAICRTKVRFLSSQNKVEITCVKEKHNRWERSSFRSCCPVNETPKEATDVDVYWPSDADAQNNSSPW